MPHRVDEGLATTLKRVAAALKQAEIPFALGGSFPSTRTAGTRAITTWTS